MTFSTRMRYSGDTLAGLFTTRETVARDTPARRATSSRVSFFTGSDIGSYLRALYLSTQNKDLQRVKPTKNYENYNECCESALTTCSQYRADRPYKSSTCEKIVDSAPAAATLKD